MDYKLIVLVVPSPETGAVDTGIARAAAALNLEIALAAPSDAAQRIRDLIGRGREPAVVLVAPGVDHATAVARQIRTVWEVGQILFVPANEHYRAVQNELRYAPMLGPNWSLIPQDDPRLGEKLARAVQASRQRTRLRTTLDRANIRLAAPKPIDDVAYRQSVISEHYLASLLQHSSDAIFSLDPHNGVLYWSKGAEQLFRFRPPARQRVNELPFWSPALDPLLERIHAGESPLKSELTAVIDGQKLHLEVSMARVQDENQAFIGTSIAVRDVSDVVRAIETERAARQHAERLGRLKDEFLALLSHELRTPLSAVIGRTQLLRMQHRNSPDIQSALEIIERNAKLQAKLIEDLLDVSAIITGKLILESQDILVTDLLSAAVASVQGLAAAKELELLTEFAIGDATIVGDADRLQQVLYNILNNAIKFTPSGGLIRVRADLGTGRDVRIVIEDTGCGISADFLPHVFDKFGQEDTSITRRHGGLGLGLSIAKQITEMHGGTIAVASPGRGLGTAFTLTFPIRLKHPDREPGPQHPATPAGHSQTLTQLKVLVVEDVADARQLVVDVLRAHGAHVLTAESATTALDVLRTETPDVLVSDIGMPDMDGYQLIEEVRRRGFSDAVLPAIALTAFASAADRQRALAAGFQAHVAKPLIVTELVSMLTTVMASRTGVAG
ncbi:hybrid sensor histidine kinase/response regulator [Massilia putida]|uniref:hybrid sensor histidine kinase/response regulator n=1 Tax=Massilia putida TaxID=1141883 RepID=UPI0012EC1787|nr:ATP-binding protein [Massilia putida]